MSLDVGRNIGLIRNDQFVGRCPVLFDPLLLGPPSLIAAVERTQEAPCDLTIYHFISPKARHHERCHQEQKAKDKS